MPEEPKPNKETKKMPPEPSLIVLLLVGLGAGIASGLFGIGGGIVIVPALIYLLGYSQHRATGTSLAVLLPPVGLAAVLEYRRSSNVDVRAAIIIAVAMLIGGGIGAIFANKLSGPQLRLMFGIFTILLGAYLIYGAMKRLGWLGAAA